MQGEVTHQRSDTNQSKKIQMKTVKQKTQMRTRLNQHKIQHRHADTHTHCFNGNFLHTPGLGQPPNPGLCRKLLLKQCVCTVFYVGLTLSIFVPSVLFCSLLLHF